MATPFLRQAGVAGLGDIGALYAAPDGSLIRSRASSSDSIDGSRTSLNGLAEDELQGLANDDSMAWRRTNCAALRRRLRGLELMTNSADRSGRDPADSPPRTARGMEADELNGFAAGDYLGGFA